MGKNICYMPSGELTPIKTYNFRIKSEMYKCSIIIQTTEKIFGSHQNQCAVVSLIQRNAVWYWCSVKLFKITSLTFSSYWYVSQCEIWRNLITGRMRVTLCHDLYRPVKMVTMTVLEFKIKLLCLLWTIRLVEKCHNPYLLYH